MGKETSTKVLPTNTEISEYFFVEDTIFEQMNLPDGRILLLVCHTWGDGEVMDFGFQYKDGISRKGINPLHIVTMLVGDTAPVTIHDICKQFLNRYNKNVQECAG